MKKLSFFLFVFLFGIALTGFSQNAPASTPATATTSPEFFAGKWDIVIVGTPNGDAKMTAELVRKEGKLSGKLKPVGDAAADPINIDKIEEEATKITLYFTAQGYDLNLPLDKVDDDNLKGSLMGMFDTTAKRVKEQK
ncbi:MAG: hypothetical protein EAZ91_12760 [Cytophagales bacterium]|nr:MAG: hypothetical protein EAZ91_12760 [Cytophagales bacterium]